MRAAYKDDTVVLAMSRRNLRALLAKLDDPNLPDSARTIYRDLRPEGGLLFVLHVEDDDEHYANRPAAGPMHPSTEAFMAMNPEAVTEV